MYSSGGHYVGETQSVFASAYCYEGERIQGYRTYTVHKANAYVRTNRFNDMGDVHAGWYAVWAVVDEKEDDSSNYYTGRMRDSAKVEKLYLLSPGEVSGNGSASGYINGVGCDDIDYDSSAFNDDDY